MSKQVSKKGNPHPKLMLLVEPVLPCRDTQTNRAMWKVLHRHTFSFFLRKSINIKLWDRK